MLTERSTQTQFLIEERRRHPGSSGELNSLILTPPHLPAAERARRILQRRAEVGKIHED
jgi:hypothetical protein